MAECHLSWESYKNNICNGFAHLQQKEEFVDMTLAADGHLVQVHKSLVALASPYIKQMLKTASCHNPVVFLNGVNYDVLSYLLEYIYSGEVKVPVERINDFLQQAKALHIVGVENMMTPMAVPVCTTTTKNKKDHITDDNRERITDSYGPGCTHNDQQNDNLQQPDTFIEPNIQTYQHNSTTSDPINIVALHSETQESSNLNTNTIVLANENTKANYEAMDTNYEANNDDFEDVIPNNYVENVNLSKVLDNKHQSSQEVDKYDLDSLISATLCGINEKHNPKDTIVDNNNTSLLPQTNTVGANIMPSQDTQSNINNGTVLSSTGIETIPNNVNFIPQIPNYQIELKMLTDGGQTTPQLITNFNPPSSQSVQSSSTNQIIFSTKETAKTDNTAYYMVTTRGRLKAILNRYVYYAHHRSNHGMKCRWRCINYRHKRCKAYMDTFGENIVNRKFLHSHPFHDDLIMKIATKCLMFSTIEEALAAAAAAAAINNTTDTQTTDDDIE